MQHACGCSRADSAAVNRRRLLSWIACTLVHSHCDARVVEHGAALEMRGAMFTFAEEGDDATDTSSVRSTTACTWRYGTIGGATD